MAEILRIGFAGLGEAATRVLPQISRLPYIKLAAAADLRKSAREAFQEEFHGAAYDSIEESAEAGMSMRSMSGLPTSSTRNTPSSPWKTGNT